MSSACNLPVVGAVLERTSFHASILSYTMRARFQATSVLAALILWMAWGAGCSSVEVTPPETEAASLPLLTEGLTVGTTLYGSADFEGLSPQARALLADGADASLGGFSFYVDWPDLEPEPGRYTLDELTAALDAVRSLGLTPLVNITVGDIETYNLPADLSDGDGGLADGVALDDEAVTERFGRLLDRLVPILVERGGFLLGVGNEVDIRFDEFPGEREAYVRFVEAARDRVHAVEPRLAVGVTLTNGAVRSQSRTYRALREVADVVPFNHAPIRWSDFTVYDLVRVRADFREVLDAYGPGPVIIQELTCPSPTSMGASPSWQRECFELLFEEIRVTPEVRFASVFTFQDFDEPTCEFISALFWGSELENFPPEMAERMRDYLCYLGLVAPDGTPKPAWEAVLEAAGSAD